MQLWSMEVHSQLVLRRQLWIEKRLWKDLMAKDDVTQRIYGKSDRGSDATVR